MATVNTIPVSNVSTGEFEPFEHDGERSGDKFFVISG